MQSQFFKLALFSTLVLSFVGLTFGQTEREKGIEFFKKKDYKSAIDCLDKVVLVNREDAEMWNMLGMAYLYTVKYKDSRKALESAVKHSPSNANYLTNLAYVNLVSNKLGEAEDAVKKAIELDPKNSNSFYIRGVINLWKGKYEQVALDADETLKLNPSSDSAYILKSDSYLYRFGEQIYKTQRTLAYLPLLEKSVAALETCLKVCSKTTDLTTVRTKFEEASAFNRYFSQKKDEIFNEVTHVTVDPTITPLQVLSKPKASYTDSARYSQIQGTTSLVILFAADGKTKTILVIKPLSNGLTEQAIMAAQQIKFIPQLKDGKPVSVVKRVDYSFTLY